MNRRIVIAVLTTSFVVAAWSQVQYNWLGSLLFHPWTSRKTDFSPSDVEILQKALGVQLSPNSHIRLATLRAAHDAIVTVHIQVPTAELEQVLRSIHPEGPGIGPSGDRIGGYTPDWSAIDPKVLTAVEVEGGRTILYSPDKDGVTNMYIELNDTKRISRQGVLSIFSHW